MYVTHSNTVTAWDLPKQLYMTLYVVIMILHKANPQVPTNSIL